MWGLGQIWTGHWSDRVGRKLPIVAGMLLQAAALGVLAASDGQVPIAAAAAVLLGVGTALVYPTLIAAISDAVSPVARAPVVGVYRFWRDMGYVAGGLIAGVVADAVGFGGAIAVVAALTAASGLWVAFDLPGSLRARGPRPTAARGGPHAMNTTDVKAFFDRVASDWDTMRIAYYDERVIERLGDFADLTPTEEHADIWLGFTPEQVHTFFAAAGLQSPSLEALGRQ